MKNREGGKPESGSFVVVKLFTTEWVALPRRSRMAKKATLEFVVMKPCFAAVKALFTRVNIFISFSKAPYSCSDSLRTLIND